MNDTDFEELLKKAVDLYMEQEDKRLEEEEKEIGDFEFSERHKKQMKELFDSLRK